MGLIVFCHGKESGPWGAKIKALAKVARRRGWEVQSLDCRATPDPDRRVRLLLGNLQGRQGRTVLVGSSMGGYVATVASKTLRPAGLFLMAPALYLPGYGDRDPVPHAGRTVAIHGWRDGVVPVENVFRFAMKHGAELHLVDAGHQLLEKMEFLTQAFEQFLADMQ